MSTLAAGRGKAAETLTAKAQQASVLLLISFSPEVQDEESRRVGQSSRQLAPPRVADGAPILSCSPVGRLAGAVKRLQRGTQRAVKP